MPRIVDQSPDPKSHIKTLMRIGYTFNSAIADILDNSLTADASIVEVLAPPGLNEPVISILDDGFGMSLEELICNMRIGCKDPSEERDKGDLGRFGSGLKTASFSQARQLTVVTKKRGLPIVAARWDIDKVEETNTWCLEVFENNEILDISGFIEGSLQECGTQIIWGKLNFIDGGNHARDYDLDLSSKLSELRYYLALYFHRFMTGRGKCTFRLNGSTIKPIDPFMSDATGYQEGPSERLRCKGGYIEIQTHVLPHFKNMNANELELLGGAAGISQSQGLYIYREKRLISAGGWMGMARNSQLSALARVQVDIPSTLDNDWSTDVKKSSLQMPPRVKRELRKFLSDPVKRSRRIHTYRGKIEAANGFWKVCEDENKGAISYQIDTTNSLLTSFLETCDARQKRLLVEYLTNLAGNLPINNIYEKMAERPSDVNQNIDEMSSLDFLVEKIFEGKQ
ncbi:ATP-binding protein [Saccharospirillum alexandrii]|uniref:ATP-binding protein n=1 Tax=Saccharospirillum alexandrii TaxID=2448477 RepID=UPI00373527CB